jgi:acyl carrier protein
MTTPTLRPTSIPAFPAAEVKQRLGIELKKIADDAVALRPAWEPLLDSQRVVGTVLAIEDLFPFRIPPDRVVRKGGYNSVEDARDDMYSRIERLWTKHNEPKVPNEQ